MEELKQKIKISQEEIDIFCCNHLVTEEEVKAIFHKMAERDSLVYQSKNEVWIQLAGPYLGIDELGKLKIMLDGNYISSYMFENGKSLNIENKEDMLLYDDQVKMIIEFRELLYQFSKNVFNFIN